MLTTDTSVSSAAMRVGYQTSCVALLFWVGCAGELENPERFALVQCDDPVEFVAATCVNANCHMAATGTVDLMASDPAMVLVDQEPPLCLGQKYIDSANPAASFILNKLTATPACGAQMPFLGRPLNAAQQACVASYVNLILGISPDAGVDAAVDAAANP